MSEFSIYFHKDFDGICSASIFLAICESFELVGIENLKLCPVDYNIKEQWLSTKLGAQCAVLDFLYHPEATWWFDHHVSTFIKSDMRKKFKESLTKAWNPDYPSCPSLIREHFISYYPLFSRTDKFQSLMDSFSEWIAASDLIDDARYDSPRDLIYPEKPCLKLNATLSIKSDDEYLKSLIWGIKEMSPSSLAGMPFVSELYKEYEKKQAEAISKTKTLIRMDNNVAFLDLCGSGVDFNRYISYFFYPEVSYTICVYEKVLGMFIVSVGKNPWKRFDVKNIGVECRRYGGGGRKNVGAVTVSNYNDAVKIADKIRKYFSD